MCLIIGSPIILFSRWQHFNRTNMVNLLAERQSLCWAICLVSLPRILLQLFYCWPWQQWEMVSRSTQSADVRFRV